MEAADLREWTCVEDCCRAGLQCAGTEPRPRAVLSLLWAWATYVRHDLTRAEALAHAAIRCHPAAQTGQPDPQGTLYEAWLLLARIAQQRFQYEEVYICAVHGGMFAPSDEARRAADRIASTALLMSA
jgi:hypothetical protein